MTKDEAHRFANALAAENPWEECRKFPVCRENLPIYPMEELDRGVNFFVLALETLGAATGYSCEGHPKGFYITFHSDYNTALTIAGWGYFQVEIEGAHYWSIRLVRSNANHKEWALSMASRKWKQEIIKVIERQMLPPEASVATFSPPSH